MRIRKVTRTITTNQVEALAYNFETNAVEYPYLEIVGDYNEKELEKMVKTAIEDGTHKFIAIHYNEKVEELYGMDEEKFILYAEKIVK